MSVQDSTDQQNDKQSNEEPILNDMNQAYAEQIEQATMGGLGSASPDPDDDE